MDFDKSNNYSRFSDKRLPLQCVSAEVTSSENSLFRKINPRSALFSSNISPIPALPQRSNYEYSESMESSRFIPTKSYLANARLKSNLTGSNDKENIHPTESKTLQASKYEFRSNERMPVLSTQHLKPFLHKFASGEVEINERGWLKVEINGKRIESSPDGMTVKFMGEVVDFKSLRRTPAKLCRLGGRFLEVIRSKTPKIVIEEKDAKCMLMRNSPFPNFEADFSDGIRVKYQIGSEMFVIYTLEGREIIVNPYLNSRYLSREVSRVLEISMDGLKKCLRREREFV